MELGESSEEGDGVRFVLELVGDALRLGTSSVNDRETTIVVRNRRDIFEIDSVEQIELSEN